ncbi:SigE family RNA polymerase sigma factor [Streptomyces sp. NBC_00988]|uniref:SigE family RNA polymerase sigma factor n=1 Tax=Streptomyces sp. NBC_00988 TaxID=2903704 RepID=UPI00386D7F4B|nr:SigE family RNA polymerase sigma factor [Streptomyces sp. NBC_00988]
MTTAVCTSAPNAAARAAAGAATRPATRPAPRPAARPATRTATRPAARATQTQAQPQSQPQSQAPSQAQPQSGTQAQTLTYPSFSSYMRARQPVLLRTARSLTANACDAEDLLQTALTKTYVAWERIEDHRALDGYVRRALLNTRTSQWRKRKVDEFACDELPEPETAGGAEDPAEQQALHDAMWRAIAKLPERQRAMVVLRYYEDLSEVQTAEVLGVSVGTVKSAVSRALGKLREDPELVLAR